MPTPRWTAISVSAFASEAEASAWHRDRLLDSESYRGSSNFEFVEGDGSVNEVESLILTPTELLLVKLKSRLGTVQADSGAWSSTCPDGRQVDENPLLLANRKAKRLAGLLRSTKALKGKSAPTSKTWSP